MKKPVKETIKRTVKKMVKPARIKEIDTGFRRKVTIVDQEGKETVKEEPIMEVLNLEPVVEEKEKDFDVWVVETGAKDKTERHEFASKKDADRYYKGS